MDSMRSGWTLYIGKSIGAALCVIVLNVAPAQADAVSDFYRGKTIELIVGAAAGGGFDLTARPLSKFLSKYLPGNPNIVIRNMPGAAGVVMANFLANGAAADGTAIGMSTSSVPFEPRLMTMSANGNNIKYDPQTLQWIGTPVREPQVSWVSRSSGVMTWEDLKAKKVRFGATSFAGDNAIFPALANKLLGLKSEIVTGYRGVAEIFLAVERGELEANNTAISNLTISKPDWLRDGNARIIMQFGLQRLASLKDVPTITELVTNPDDLRMLKFFLLKFEMSRPIFAPPRIPQDRLEALRDAFNKAVHDPEFIAESKKIGIDVDPLDGRAIAKMVDEIMATPQPVVDRLKAALSEMAK